MQRYGRKKMRGTPTWHPSVDSESRGDMKGRARQEERRVIREELDTHTDEKIPDPCEGLGSFSDLGGRP